MSKVWIIIWLR